jgi:hypothetical protein
MSREIENALLLLIKDRIIKKDLVADTKESIYRISEIYQDQGQLEIVAYNLHKEHDPEDEDRVDLVISVSSRR